MGEEKVKEIVLNDKYTLFVYRDENVTEITEFVAKVYYNNGGFDFECDLKELEDGMKSADGTFGKSEIIFCVKDNNKEICCTGRLLKKSETLPVLPIEEEFDINLNFFEADGIYEFARFASNGRVSFFVISKIIKQMLEEMDVNNSYLFASIDETLYRKFKRIKYPFYRLGKSIFYMGSSTVPIGIKLSELSAMYEKVCI